MPSPFKQPPTPAVVQSQGRNNQVNGGGQPARKSALRAGPYDGQPAPKSLCLEFESVSGAEQPMDLELSNASEVVGKEVGSFSSVLPGGLSGSGSAVGAVGGAVCSVPGAGRPSGFPEEVAGDEEKDSTLKDLIREMCKNEFESWGQV